MANDSNFDRNPLRGCNYGLEGGAFLILGGAVLCQRKSALVNKKWTQKRKKWAGKYELLIRRGGGIGHSELNGCQIVKRIGRSLLIECF